MIGSGRSSGACSGIGRSSTKSWARRGTPPRRAAFARLRRHGRRPRASSEATSTTTTMWAAAITIMADPAITAVQPTVVIMAVAPASGSVLGPVVGNNQTDWPLSGAAFSFHNPSGRSLLFQRSLETICSVSRWSLSSGLPKPRLGGGV